MDDLIAERSDWEERYLELRHDLLHHIEEEEQELFPLSQDTLSEQELRKIGEEMVLVGAEA